jgi:hypothetical protein
MVKARSGLVATPKVLQKHFRHRYQGFPQIHDFVLLFDSGGRYRTLRASPRIGGSVGDFDDITTFERV